MSLLDFLVLTLAASGLVDVWKNGSIFADWRAFFQDKADEPPTSIPVDDTPIDDDDGGEKLPFLMRVADKLVPPILAELVSCSFCLSHHTPYLLALLCFFPALFVTATWAVFLLKLPVYSLAASRAGTLLNALFPDARYDR